MKLIADSGSTKTSWCLINNNQPEIYFDTEGFNPYYVDSEYIRACIIEKLPAVIAAKNIAEIHFYGAGCSGDKNHIVSTALKSVFPAAAITVDHDLLAAARAVLGRSAGFVAILGTGMASCIYNGENITHQIDSLGFILGDEGSGAYIGKKLLIDYGRDRMPKDLKTEFFETYKLSPDDIINEVYTKPMPNRFCAGFCRFIILHIQHPYISALVKSAFADCFNNLISLYPAYKTYTLNCVGSIGYKFSDLLSTVAAGYGMRTGNIIKTPIEGLVKYHSQNN
ncbi:ATPase [Mucilaginibacter gynuensis]|uniref:ATPase n=1 Tax=Mucilaginibacter gynuensis TaxID=1302236 RepID=A0ABP8FVM6_9SPHI